MQSVSCSMYLGFSKASRFSVLFPSCPDTTCKQHIFNIYHSSIFSIFPYYITYSYVSHVICYMTHGYIFLHCPKFYKRKEDQNRIL